MVFRIFSNCDSVIEQIRLPISAEWIVNTFANFTIERFGNFPRQNRHHPTELTADHRRFAM